MTPRLPLLTAVLLAAACGGGPPRAGTAPTPTPAAPPGVAPSHSPTVQFAPATTHYLVRQDLHIQQDFAGLPPTIDLRYGLFLTAAIGAPADSGLPTTFTIDSIVVDSATQLPPQINLTAARGYRITGRLLFTGEFISGPCDTSAAASGVSSLLPRFRSFFPRLPVGGVRPAMTWSDSTDVTDNPVCSGGSSITTRSANQRTAASWEDHAGSRALRLESTSNYRFNGSGQQSGNPFTIDGSGAGTATAYVSSDGRYLGGEQRDSATLTIDLQVQGITIPRRQFSHTVVTALPR
ncbi:MAG TPA: hypothetical protein VFP39_12580 [Gemmatimonadales bacterium]|nr:hypothetical protein [Gemmatimonadales bacterium]